MNLIFRTLLLSILLPLLTLADQPSGGVGVDVEKLPQSSAAQITCRHLMESAKEIWIDREMPLVLKAASMDALRGSFLLISTKVSPVSLIKEEVEYFGSYHSLVNSLGARMDDHLSSGVIVGSAGIHRSAQILSFIESSGGVFVVGSSGQHYKAPKQLLEELNELSNEELFVGLNLKQSDALEKYRTELVLEQRIQQVRGLGMNNNNFLNSMELQRFNERQINTNRIPEVQR